MKYYAVIDTNVIVSAMLSQKSVPSDIVGFMFAESIIPLLSESIIDEYNEVLKRPKFKFDHKEVDKFIKRISQIGLFIDVEPLNELLPDPKDVVFYEVVMEKRKNDDAYLVTGNIKHFPAKPFIVTPREMYEMILNETI